MSGSTDRIKGRVKWFTEKKGFGFIVGNDGEEYFVHYTKISGEGFKNLIEGQDVEFSPMKDPKSSPKGPSALDVQVL